MTLPYPLNHEDLFLVETEVHSAFEPDELKKFKTFEAFWAEVEVWNAYEEDWNNEKEYWRPYFYEVYNKLISK